MHSFKLHRLFIEYTYCKENWSFYISGIQFEFNDRWFSCLSKWRSLSFVNQYSTFWNLSYSFFWNPVSIFDYIANLFPLQKISYEKTHYRFDIIKQSYFTQSCQSDSWVFGNRFWRCRFWSIYWNSVEMSQDISFADYHGIPTCKRMHFCENFQSHSKFLYVNPIFIAEKLIWILIFSSSSYKENDARRNFRVILLKSYSF